MIFFSAMWSSSDLFLKHFSDIQDFDEGQVMLPWKKKKFTHDDGEKMSLTGRSLKLIAPFKTYSDALEMIINLTSYSEFTVIAIQNYLKALPKTKSLIKHINTQV